MINRESLLNLGESLTRFDTSGWVVPERQLPVGSDVIVDWPSTWPRDEIAGPFRATVDRHFFNGVIRVTWPKEWPRQAYRDTINLGDDCWRHIWIVDKP